MAVGFQITSLLLGCLLSEVCDSAVFPRAGSFQPYKGGQPHKNYGFGYRRPLDYHKALWQHHEKMQPSSHDQFQDPNRQKPQGNPWSVGRHGTQLSNQPVPHETRIQHNVRPQGRTPFQSNYPPPKPKNLEFSVRIPFLNFDSESIETHGSDGNENSQLYRQSNVQIQSSFESPYSTNDFSNKGSTNYPNRPMEPHDVSKQSFNFSLSVPLLPVPSAIQLPKPSSSDVDDSAKMESAGSPSVYPPSFQQGSTPTGFSYNLPTSAQLQEHQINKPTYTKSTESYMMDHSQEHVNQHKYLTDQISHGDVPTRQNQGVLQPIMPKPQSFLPISSFPNPQSASGYHTVQLNPTNDYLNSPSGQTFSASSTNAFDPVQPPAQSAYYGGGKLKPSASSYGSVQTEQPAGSLVFSSEKYNRAQIQPSTSQGQKEEAALQSSAQSSAPTLYKLLLSSRRPTSYSNKQDSRVPTRQSGLSSSSRSSAGQTRRGVLPDHLSTSRQLPNHQSLPIQYPASVQKDVKPQYAKLFIDIEDETSDANNPLHGVSGLQNYFAPQEMQYAYPGRWTGQNMAGMSIGNPDPLSVMVSEPQSVPQSWLQTQHQPAGYGEMSTEHVIPPDYALTYPNMEPGMGPSGLVLGHPDCALYQAANAGYKQSPESHPVVDGLNPNYGSYVVRHDGSYK